MIIVPLNADVGPSTDNPSEDVVLNDSTEISSFYLLVNNNRNVNESMQWPSHKNDFSMGI